MSSGGRIALSVFMILWRDWRSRRGVLAGKGISRDPFSSRERLDGSEAPSTVVNLTTTRRSNSIPISQVKRLPPNKPVPRIVAHGRYDILRLGKDVVGRVERFGLLVDIFEGRAREVDLWLAFLQCTAPLGGRERNVGRKTSFAIRWRKLCRVSVDWRAKNDEGARRGEQIISRKLREWRRRGPWGRATGWQMKLRCVCVS